MLSQFRIYMIYEYFNRKTDERIERNFPMGKYPDTVKHNGQTFKRIISVPQISADVKNVVHKYPYVSSALPKKLPGCEHTKDGKPIITSRQHERNIASQENCYRE